MNNRNILVAIFILILAIGGYFIYQDQEKKRIVREELETKRVLDSFKYESDKNVRKINEKYEKHASIITERMRLGSSHKAATKFADSVMPLDKK